MNVWSLIDSFTLPSIPIKDVVGFLKDSLLLYSTIVTLMFNNNDSTAINNIFVNPLTRTAEVEFAGGDLYHYTNVPFRGLVEYVLNDQLSLGQWVNTWLKDGRANYEFVGYNDFN